MLQGLFKLKGVVQHYSWGGFDFIPRLLGFENKEHKPFAEYWLGAHPNHSALLENDSMTSLAAFLKKEFYIAVVVNAGIIFRVTRF